MPITNLNLPCQAFKDIQDSDNLEALFRLESKEPYSISQSLYNNQSQGSLQAESSKFCRNFFRRIFVCEQSVTRLQASVRCFHASKGHCEDEPDQACNANRPPGLLLPSVPDGNDESDHARNASGQYPPSSPSRVPMVVMNPGRYIMSPRRALVSKGCRINALCCG
jgi:hypothetical protein